MKRLFLFLLCLSFLSVNAQEDQSKDTIHLTIPAWKYGYLTHFADKGTPEAQAYLRRMVKRWNGVDTVQMVTTITTLGQFVDTYKQQMAGQDGLVADFNIELLNDVLPQAMRKPWLLQQIQEIKIDFARRRQELKEAGIKYLQEIKKSMEIE